MHGKSYLSTGIPPYRVRRCTAAICHGAVESELIPASFRPVPVIDISTAAKQAADGYFISVVKTSSAEMIQAWNPGARVVKAFAVQASYVVDDPTVVGGPVSVPIAADDPQAKEIVARIVVAMGMDPFDAGPLRYSQEIEAFARLYMVPLLQRRTAAWEPYFRRSYFWECEWSEDYSDPVADHDTLADIPQTQGPARPCPGK